MKEFTAYHLVTNQRMSRGQVIHFEEKKMNTLYRFFWKRNTLIHRAKIIRGF